MTLRRSVAAFTLAALLTLPAAALAVGVGDTAPDFSFTDVQSDSTLTLSSFHGKVVVLAFFFYG